MLINTAKKSIEKHFDPSKPVIIAPTVPIKNMFLKAAKRALGKGHPELAPRTQHFFGIADLVSTPFFSVHGPAVGAPVAAIVLEPLLQLGAKDIVLLSICGGICGEKQSVDIGDFIFPSGAISDEGTSRHYGADEFVDYMWPAGQNELKMRLGEKLNGGSLGGIVEGKIWTTDAIYKETPEKVRQYAGKGAVGVDMEMSLILHLCNEYGASLSSVFVVSDVAGDGYKMGVHKKNFLGNFELACELVCDVIGVGC